MILLPKIENPGSGIRFKAGSGYAQGGMWFATWTVREAGKSDKRPLRSLRTADRSEAIRRRDALHAELRKQGAVTADKDGRKKGEPKA